MIHWLTDWLFEDPSKLIALIGFFLSIFTLVQTTWDRMKEQASKFGVSWVRLDLAKVIESGEAKASKISLVSPEDLGPLQPDWRILCSIVQPAAASAASGLDLSPTSPHAC